ncbi:hypothetical protein [Ligilactobacillus equi]|uniref:hypothetical protein n=1 Tax=Ligilactobacillus equi TaxID=137357 RepID=UPI0003FF0852|nr:hypothetical protein [Ligilactobacillus equi]
MRESKTDLVNNLYKIFCDNLDEYLMQKDKSFSAYDTNAYHWLSITSNELIDYISIIKRFKLDRMLKKEHPLGIKPHQGLLLRISEIDDEITYIAPLSPLGVCLAYPRDEQDEVNMKMKNYFIDWVKEEKKQEFDNAIKNYWDNIFGINDLDINISYIANKNQLTFSVSTHLKNKKNLRKYYWKISQNLYKGDGLSQAYVNKRKQRVVLTLSIFDEIYIP